MKVILAESAQAAEAFVARHEINDAVIFRDFRSIEGLRFRYEDVIRAPGWSKNPQIEEVEDLILRTHIRMGCARREDDDPNLPIHTRDYLRMVYEGTLEGVCTYGTVTH